ncbi:hypothetical protein DERF_001665 [Dermatophagoides farinae]|uniref:Uncharacterized protein n=1 Tax=Dermatophagoides farinae TaxID=6954 RepID=A0A922IFC9_DERFA|nr:hypothetical protein DERF_001665 [Dermatophagoides farinae]
MDYIKLIQIRTIVGKAFQSREIQILSDWYWVADHSLKRAGLVYSVTGLILSTY